MSAHSTWVRQHDLAADLGFYLVGPDERDGWTLVWTSDLPPPGEPERRPATITETVLWAALVERETLLGLDARED